MYLPIISSSFSYPVSVKSFLQNETVTNVWNSEQEIVKRAELIKGAHISYSIGNTIRIYRVNGIGPFPNSSSYTFRYNETNVTIKDYYEQKYHKSIDIKFPTLSVGKNCFLPMDVCNIH